MSHNCTHNGPSLTVIAPGLEIYGASQNEAEKDYYKFDLVISLGVSCKPKDNKYSDKSIIRSIGLQRILNRYLPNPEHLYLDWPDYGIPKLSKDFWLELVRVLKKKGRDRDRNGRKYRVVVHCQGGHGRTGTALSLLGTFIEGWDKEIIEEVRKRHCRSCVESNSQIEYVEDMTGIKSKIKGSKIISSLIYSSSGSSSSKSNSNRLPDNMCHECRVMYSSISEAIACENKHREDRKKPKDDKDNKETKGTSLLLSSITEDIYKAPCTKHGVRKCIHCYTDFYLKDHSKV